MLDIRKQIKSGKGKVAISALILSLGLSGCSFSLNKDKSNADDNKIFITYDGYTEDKIGNEAIDKLLGFDRPSNEKLHGKNLDYTYLIDNSNETNATLAHVIDEVIITSNGEFLDSKKEMSSETFNLSIIQPITLPKAFILYDVESVSDLVRNYGDMDIDCKKFITLDGETLYYFEGMFKFNKFSEQVGLISNDGEYMMAKALYKLQDNGRLIELYKNQTGFMSDSDNVISENYNNDNEIVIPISETVFVNVPDEYSKNYIIEALDTYSGKDNFYAQENEGKDFSAYKKY